MTKQEKIQEAYGEYFNKDINDNGWCSNHSLRIRVDALEIDRSRFGWRPKSLQGIEANNGWIKIESESDLPKTEDDYHIFIDNKDLSIAYFDKSDGWSIACPEITHYQSIIKPEAPIY